MLSSVFILLSLQMMFPLEAAALSHQSVTDGQKLAAGPPCCCEAHMKDVLWCC